jgi:hypothetical protein
MTFMLLRQNAAESRSVSGCGLCGAVSPGGARDHLLVGQPGTPSADVGLCPSCGDVLVHLTKAVRRRVLHEGRRGARHGTAHDPFVAPTHGRR